MITRTVDHTRILWVVARTGWIAARGIDILVASEFLRLAACGPELSPVLRASLIKRTVMYGLRYTQHRTAHRHTARHGPAGPRCIFCCSAHDDMLCHHGSDMFSYQPTRTARAPPGAMQPHILQRALLRGVACVSLRPTRRVCRSSRVQSARPSSRPSPPPSATRTARTR